MMIGAVSSGNLCLDISTRRPMTQSNSVGVEGCKSSSSAAAIWQSEEAQEAFRAYLQEGMKNVTMQDTSTEEETSGVSLSGSDIDALVQKYDPNNMTQQEYNDFLDELYYLGVLTEKELSLLGYSDSSDAVAALVTPLDFGILNRGFLANGENLPSSGWQPGFSFGAYQVDVLSMAQWEKSFKYYDAEQSEWLPSSKARAYQKMYDVLLTMSEHK